MTRRSAWPGEVRACRNRISDVLQERHSTSTCPLRCCWWEESGGRGVASLKVCPPIGRQPRSRKRRSKAANSASMAPACRSARGRGPSLARQRGHLLDRRHSSMVCGGAADGSASVSGPPALVAGLDDDAVMGEPIEQRGGHLGVAERQIGRDDDRGVLVGSTDEVEQQLPAARANGRWPSMSRIRRSSRDRCPASFPVRP